MLKYTLQRILYMLLVFFIITFTNFYNAYINIISSI